MNQAPAKKSDLGVRTASAVVMLAVAGGALWAGGPVWSGFVVLLALGCLFEWARLVLKGGWSVLPIVVWLLLGGIYIIGGANLLHGLRVLGVQPIIEIVGLVIAVDVGAYFTGRALGGPKIAPAISPSKTWSGLIGGMVAASLVAVAITYSYHASELAAYEDYVRDFGVPVDWQVPVWSWWLGIAVGCVATVVAQAGDFLESWMKRRAGVKDSSQLIPGHGGVLDRADGLLAVLALYNLYNFALVSA